ncbi:DsbA family protein [Candidatus Woesearchaeota archaeon]|nr:DsbA family protein [Candidatus Woesearchaeota archaeon]
MRNSILIANLASFCIACPDSVELSKIQNNPDSTVVNPRPYSLDAKSDLSDVKYDPSVGLDAGYVERPDSGHKEICGVYSEAPRGECEIDLEWFVNFQEPFSRRFYDETLPCIEINYKPRIAKRVRHFQLDFFPRGQKAAEASECARDQGMFWDYATLLFANQGALDDLSLKQYALSLGLDTRLFNSCLDSGIKTSIFNTDNQDGINRGVQGIPTFFISGNGMTKTIEGAQPYNEFAKALNEVCD